MNYMYLKQDKDFFKPFSNKTRINTDTVRSAMGYQA